MSWRRRAHTVHLLEPEKDTFQERRRNIRRCENTHGRNVHLNPKKLFVIHEAPVIHHTPRDLSLAMNIYSCSTFNPPQNPPAFLRPYRNL